MVLKVAVLGSCESRDLFNSIFNPNYKENFSIEFDALRTSIISLMQNPHYINKELLKIYPENIDTNKATSFLVKDFEKTFFKDLSENSIDLLIIDNYFEVHFGVGYFDNILLTNNLWDLTRTEFYKNTQDIKIISMLDNKELFYNLWKKYCDLFFKYMSENFPKTKIILNMARLTGIVEKKNGEKYINKEFYEKALKFNPLISHLDNYIINKYGIDVLEFNFEKYYSMEKHPWGESPNHYTFNYYNDMIKQLLCIANENVNLTKSKNKIYLNKINKLDNKFNNLYYKYIYLKKQYEKVINENSKKEIENKCVFKDNGIKNDNNHSNWYFTGEYNYLINEKYTKIQIKKDGGLFACNSIKKWDNTFCWSFPCIIEFDIIDYVGEIQLRIISKDNQINATKSFNELQIKKDSHVKIVIDESTVTYYIDNYAYYHNYSLKNVQIGFRLINATLFYKNFKILYYQK